MKMTKKIISVLLAVMLVVTSVAIAASADMLTEKAGTVLTYTAVVKGKTANAEGAIEVEPGEKITVEVYTQTNYYIGSVGSELFAWTNSFFGSLTSEDWHLHNHINNYTPNQKYPVTGNQLGSNYASGYEGFLYGRAYNTNFTTPTDASTPVLSYSFDLTVEEGLADGTTGKFLMPEQMLGLSTANARFRQIYASVASNADVYGTVADASQYPETINVSGAVINFVVKSAAAEVLGEIKDVVTSSTLIGDTAVINVEVTGSPESLRVTTPSGDKTITRDDATIETSENGEIWTIEILAEAATTACTVYANYGAAGETAGTDFTIEAFEYCDYTALQQAVNTCSELDSAEEYYDPTDLATWKAALKAAQDLLAAEKLVKTDENQATINNAAQALTNAYDELYEIYVDTAPLSQAIAAYKTPEKAPEFYDSAKYAAWQAALAAAQDGVIDYDGAADTAANRAAVAGLAADLKAAYEALEANYVDTTALSQAIAAYGAVDYAAEYYDAAEYAAWTDALATANTALGSLAQAADTAENRAAVADFAATLKAAYEALDARFVDTSALEKAVNDYAATDYTAEYYDAAEYAAYTDALAAAQAGVTTYADKADTAANQAAVAALAADLKAAFEALDARFVDTSALDEALVKTPAYGAEYYDAAAYAAFQDAVSAGNGLVAQLAKAADTEANRKAVADAAEAINSAFAKLVPEFIDYSALEEAVKNYGATPEAADAYTTETYGPYAAALERAQDMLANKNENAPASDEALAAQISAAATELESTFKALELAPVDAIITKVTAKSAHYKVGDTVEFDFVCSVTNVAKIQLVFDNGSTTTYHRRHSAVKAVVDNGDGTETWTIAHKVYFESANVTAKAKLGNTWEKNGYKFAMVTSNGEDFSVKSAEVLLNDAAVSEFTVDDTVVIKVVCGPDTLRMRLVDKSNGCTSTFSRSKATQDQDGNWVWLITRKCDAGDHAFDIYTTGSENYLTDEGTDLTFKVTAPVDYDGPSTGNDADIVISATAKARVLRGNDQTFTVVTDKDCLGVRIIDQNGNSHAYTKDVASAVDNGDGTLTWTLTATCLHADTYTCSVEALYTEWMSNGTTVSYRVVY